jgi:peptidoglycan/LPS O-acetylase OafA/YrhL
MPKSRSTKIVAASHCLVGFAVFMKGTSKTNDLAHNWPLVLLCCSFGVLIFLFALFHRRVEKTWLRVSPLVSLLEAIVAASLGVVSMRHGQHLLPYAWFLASVGAVIAGVVHVAAPQKKAT